MDLQQKFFHLSDILSVTTGRFLCLPDLPAMPDGTQPPLREPIYGLYDILGFITDSRDIETSQLARASKESKEALIKQHPFLKDVTFPGIDENAIHEQVLGPPIPSYMTEWQEKIRKAWNKPGYEHARPFLEQNFGSPEKLALDMVHSSLNNEWTQQYAHAFIETITEGRCKNAAAAKEKDAWLNSELYQDTLELDAHIHKLKSTAAQTQISDWMSSIIAKHGAYLPITQLDRYEYKTSQEEVLAYKPDAVIIGIEPDEEGFKIHQPHFHLSLEEVAKLDVPDYPILAQGILALTNPHVPNFLLNPESIKQHGAAIEISTGTLSYDKAMRFYEKFSKIMPPALFGENMNLQAAMGREGSEEEYVIRIDAEALANKEVELSAYVNQTLGFTPSTAIKQAAGQGRFSNDQNRGML